MDRITIETMELKNFKCHGQLSLVLKDQKLQILGAESSGKTSIQDAWCWLLYGKDSRGSSLMEVRPLGHLSWFLRYRYHDRQQRCHESKRWCKQ